MTDNKLTATATRAAFAESFDEATAEHVSLGDEYVRRESSARTVSRKITIRDRLRGRVTTLTFFAEGFINVSQVSRGRKKASRTPLDLRYLDAAPEVSRHHPRRFMQATGITAGIAVLLVALAVAGIAAPVMIPGAAIACAGAIITAISWFYRSHEEIRFYTLHGRALVMRLVAGRGYIRRYRKLLNTIANAIDTAADEIDEDTIAHLRAEMREHYRMKEIGLLSQQECSAATTRILAHFETPG